MIPIEDLTDVTLAIEDTDEDDEEGEEDEEDLTDVTLVSDWAMVYSDKIKQCLQSSQKLFTGSCLREVSNYEFW